MRVLELVAELQAKAEHAVQAGVAIEDDAC